MIKEIKMDRGLSLTINTPREEFPIQILVLYPDEVCCIEQHFVKDDAQVKLLMEFKEKWVDLFLKNSREEKEK